MTYSNPQHNTSKYSCTPFPILKHEDPNNGIVTYLDLISLGNIQGFGVNLTEIGGTRRWDNTTISDWPTFFTAINEHLTIFNERIQELERQANPDAITITSNANNQLEANVDNVSWSSNSTKIVVNPGIGKTTIYSLASSATSYGSFRLTTDTPVITEGASITLKAQWSGYTTTYDAIITASKSGMTSATKQVQLPKDAVCPSSVTLDNGQVIGLDSNGYGTCTYTPNVGNHTVKTTGHETVGVCNFTVEANQVPPTPDPNYYWYAGAGPVNTAITPGNGADWHLISGTPTSIATGEQSSSSKINWVLAVPTALNLNHISNGALDVTSGYDITTVTCADGVEYKVFTQISQSKKTDRIFIA